MLPETVRPLAARIAALAGESALTVYLVGGSVRDALLGRPMRDIDIAVDGDALAFAQRLSDELPGHFVALDAERACARVVLDGAAVACIDVSPLEGTLAADLARRDFTVDALAAPISGGDVIGVPRGLEDLDAGLVRAVAFEGFDADPLRLLRAVRIAAELGFEIEALTAQAIRARAPALRTSAAERRRDELARIFALDDACRALRTLDDLGLFDVLFPELAAGRGVAQPAEFHVYDVFEHGLRTVEALDEMLAALAGPPVAADADSVAGEVARGFAWRADAMGAYLNEEMSEGRTRAAALKAAGLLHDVAKPQTRTQDADGRLRFLGHADEGAKIAARVMRRFRFSTREVRFVSLLVEQHLRPVQLAPIGEAPTRRALYRFYRDLGDAMPAVLLLALADAAASRGPRLTSGGWSQHVRYMNALLVRSVEDAVIVDPPRLLSGRDIIDETGEPEGPRIGVLLEALKEAQAAGEVSGRDEAVAFVRSQIDSEGGGPH